MSTESGLTEEQILQICQELIGTADSVDSVLMRFDLDAETDAVESDISTFGNLEMCSGCGWWFEAGELVDDEGEVVGCPDCRPEQDDE